VNAADEVTAIAQNCTLERERSRDVAGSASSSRSEMQCPKHTIAKATSATGRITNMIISNDFTRSVISLANAHGISPLRLPLEKQL
jgi:hypothetical protein